MAAETQMKVGIVTQPLYANYGGILQNYALQQVLKKMGHTPVTLDYFPSLSFGRYLLYFGKSVVCLLSPSKRHPIKPYKHYLERPAAIDAFVRNNIDTIETISNYSRKILHKYGIEALIVGSDQVWRYAYNAYVLEDMYLAFAKGYPCKKIAYAASFGVEMWDYPEEKSEKATALAKQFDAVSVREDSGVGLCRENLGVEAITVLDPTLLLAETDYERFCKAPSTGDKPYLAAYILDINAEKKEYIEALAIIKGLEIKDMTVTDKGISIEEWLTTIRNAEYVITDSYHGSLFSIIFQKQFQTILNKERGADRFFTLFGELGLTDRLLDEIPSSTMAMDSIDYSAVNQKLKQLQNESNAFLQHSLK